MRAMKMSNGSNVEIRLSNSFADCKILSKEVLGREVLLSLPVLTRICALSDISEHVKIDVFSKHPVGMLFKFKPSAASGSLNYYIANLEGRDEELESGLENL